MKEICFINKNRFLGMNRRKLIILCMSQISPYDLISNELNRYLNTDKRRLIAMVENLWDKYAVSSRELENRQSGTLWTPDGYLKALGDLEEGL